MTQKNIGMKIVFFCKDKKSLPPVEEFLVSRYGKNLNLFPKEMIKIRAALGYAIEKNGICDGGLFIEKYRGYDALCIRTKLSRVLIRFPFYRDVTNYRLVLLLGFIKIDGYKPGGKIDREADRQMDKAQEYYEEYNVDNSKFKITNITKDLMI